MPDNPVQDAPKLFKEVAPAEFHDRGWIKPFLEKPFTPELGVELTKKLDGAETLIGKKTLIPGPDVTDEKELGAFYGKLRPSKVEEYEFDLGEKPNEEFVKEIRTAAFEAGLDKRQLAKFIAGIKPGMVARQEAAAAEKQKQDKEFEGIVAKTFDKEGEKVLERVRNALQEFTPEPLRVHVDKLDNNALAVLTGVINSVLVKYVPEDDLRGKEKGSAGTADKDALRKEARELQGSEAWKDFRHPDHERTKKRVAEIYADPAFK